MPSRKSKASSPNIFRRIRGWFQEQPVRIHAAIIAGVFAVLAAILPLLLERCTSPASPTPIPTVIPDPTPTPTLLTSTPTLTSTSLTATPTLTPTPTLEPTPIPTPTCTGYDLVVESCQVFPEQMPLNVREVFVVKCEIRNSGDCPWGKDFEWTSKAEDTNLSRSDSTGRVVDPGETIEVIVGGLKAPPESEQYEIQWQMMAPPKQWFGSPYAIEIDVDTLASPSVPCTPGMGYESDLTYDDHNGRDFPLVSPGMAMYKVWRIRNDGTCPWGEGYKLVHDYDTKWESGRGWLDVEDVFFRDIEPARVRYTMPYEAADVIVYVTTPHELGKYRSYWKMQDDSGHEFGRHIWIQVEVADQP
jgi:hypothetical protein